MSLNILITGGAGYLGSIMVPELLADGHNITVLDNFMFNQASLNNCCANNNFKVVKGDIRQNNNMIHLMKTADSTPEYELKSIILSSH